jgi:hypothetical protein
MEDGAVGHNFERFGLIRFRGFRGKDLNVKFTTYDGCQVMGKVLKLKKFDEKRAITPK